MDDMTQTVHHPRAVEVDARRLLVGKGVETGALPEGFQGTLTGVAPDRLEERVARSDPLQVVLVRSLSASGAARIAVGDLGQLPG